MKIAMFLSLFVEVYFLEILDCARGAEPAEDLLQSTALECFRASSLLTVFDSEQAFAKSRFSTKLCWFSVQ